MKIRFVLVRVKELLEQRYTPCMRAGLAAAAVWLVCGWPAGTARAAAPVTFTRDVAPILFTHCATCHRPDGPAPFSLLTFADARRHAAQIVAVTRERVMPPWKPEPDGPPLLNDRRLTRAQIDSFERWLRDGTPQGAAADLPPAPEWPSAWQLGTPDLVVDLPEHVVPAGGADVFRNFVVPVPGAAARYVRGLEFRPGNRAVHHANIRIDPTRASRQLDDADPTPGYEGAILKTADYPDGHFLGWTPGQITPLAPPGLAWRLDAGSDLVVQLHLQPTGKVERIRPSIALYFTADAPRRTPTMVRLGRQRLEIPAGAAAYHVVDRYVLPVDVEVHAVQPHAHYRAGGVTVSAARPDGTRSALLRIERWDFNWQDQYRYAAPFWLPAGTAIEMDYVFDNSDANPRNPAHPAAPVSWGWRSSDEMADVWIQVMTRSEADRARLAPDIRRKMAAEDAIGCEVLIAREPEYPALRNDAAALYMELGEPEQALTHFRAVERMQPASARAHYNVAVALEALGRGDAAMRGYEAAIRLDPGYSSAHNNLGSLLLTRRRLDEARAEFARAVAADPANTEAHNNLGAALLASGAGPAARAALDRAIALRPEYAEAHFNLARLDALEGRSDEALSEAAIAEAQAVAAGKMALRDQIQELRRELRRR
jgi:tetratricopeptide (TPR) repeat protein/mono/diheme cytochrome c family protein